MRAIQVSMTNLTDIIGPHFYGTSRPGFMQDQDQDLLVHQDQDQDQGLAQELPGNFRGPSGIQVGSFCCIIGTLGERRANQDKEKTVKEN